MAGAVATVPRTPGMEEGREGTHGELHRSTEGSLIHLKGGAGGGLSDKAASRRRAGAPRARGVGKPEAFA